MTCMRRLMFIVLLALLALPTHESAHGEQSLPVDPFVLLLKGIYQPVTKGPELGLSIVDLDDGTFAKCDVLRDSGLPGATEQAVGTFWVNFDVTLCAYQLPGGTFSAIFTEFIWDFVEIEGELYQVGTAELVIPEATGIYRQYVGGSVHMEFVTRMIDEFTFEEFCYCFIIK